MTISNTTQRADYVGSGTTGPFTFNFKILSTGQLRVIKQLIASPYTETELALTTDYTVSITGPSSGSITLVSSLSSSYNLIILRDMDFTQESAFRTQGQQNASSWENAHDTAIMCALQLKRGVDGSIRIPDTEDPSDFTLTLPLAAERANTILSFDDDGNVSQNGSLSVQSITVSGLDVGSVPYVDANNAIATSSALQFDPTGKVLSLDDAEVQLIRGAAGPSYNDALHIGGIKYRSTSEVAFTSGLLLRFSGGYLFEDITSDVVVWRFIIAVNGNSNFGMASSNTKTPLSKLEVTGNFLVGPESWTGVYEAPTNGAIVQGAVGIGTVTPGGGSPLGCKLQITADKTTNDPQVYITGETSELKQLRLGYNTTGNYGVIDAILSGTGAKGLVLQPSGGKVSIGAIDPADYLHIYQANPYILIESTSTGENGIKFKLNSTQRWLVGNPASDAGLGFINASTQTKLYLDQTGSLVVNHAAIATNATDGFLYIPSCAGTPTGTPTSFSGRVPIVVDTVAHKLYFYDGSWRDAGP
jgi:hypothetical protein